MHKLKFTMSNGKKKTINNVTTAAIFPEYNQYLGREGFWIDCFKMVRGKKVNHLVNFATNIYMI